MGNEMMHNPLLWEKLNDLVSQWQGNLPSYEALMTLAQQMAQWKRQHDIRSMWPTPPRMVTATIDDSIGQGIAIINRYARLAGLQVTPLGLMQSPQAIVSACRDIQPKWLGLTVLQLDSEDDLCAIAAQLPPVTRLIAGGPALVIDSELGQRAGVHHTARNLSGFIDILLADAKNIQNKNC
jgi:methylmalonyl-CoA mutase cobalamin-binding subunit